MSARRTKGILVQQKSAEAAKASAAQAAKPVQKARKIAPKKRSKKLILKRDGAEAHSVVQITDRIERTLAKPKTTTLATLSPYRFPIPRTKTAALIARIAGLCFIVTGALFSFITATPQGVLTEGQIQAQYAQTVTGTHYGTTTAVPPITQPTTVNTAPAITISAPGGVLEGNVKITVTAAVDRVELFAQNAQGIKLKLGTARSTDNPSLWFYEWKTTEVSNGEYQLEAIVWKGDRSYQKRLEGSVIVENGEVESAPVDEEENQPEADATNATAGTPVERPAVNPEEVLNTTNTANTATTNTVPTQTTTTPTPTATAAVVSVALSVGQSGLLSGSVPLSVRVEGAQHVRISAYNTETGALYHAGTATNDAPNVWKLSWDTQNVVDGRYRLVAYASIQGTEHVSGGVIVRVQKSTTAPAVPPDSDIPPEEEIPETPITLSLSKSDPLSEYVDITVDAEAVSVELYRQPVQSLSPFFLGQARKINDTKWSYTWNTHEAPNGDYRLFARIRNEYGFVDSAKTRIQVRNVMLDTFTTDQTQAIDTLTNVTDSLLRPVSVNPDSPDLIHPNNVYIEPVDIFVATIETEDAGMQAELTRLLAEYRTRLDTELNTLALALRTDDAAGIETVRAAIDALKQEILANVPESSDRERLVERISAYLDKIAYELDGLTVKNNTILKERIGEAVVTDSDKDGISDYDEIHLYQTNPFTADTDGDGFIDSVEITQGFNPHDSRSEALIAYESPQETGIVREDLLEVRAVSTIVFDRSEETEKRALFAGKGLPNSFVTLYIYSTPIVVTVKTDSDGSWNYILDKDLEDGAHTVYIGITDNAGRLVAKSTPLPFVKTAEAYTSLGTTVLPTADADGTPAFINSGTALFAASLLLVVLGLVLLLIGMFAHPRLREGEPLPAA